MSHLPFPNFTNQQFGHEKPSQNHLVQRQPWPEVEYHQRMLPPQSEYYMSPQQPPPPPPAWVPSPQAPQQPRPTWVPPPQAPQQPLPTWVPPPPPPQVPLAPPPAWIPPPQQPLPPPPPLPPMIVPPPPVQAQVYPCDGTLVSNYQSIPSNQEQQQFCETNTDEPGKLYDQNWISQWLNEVMPRKNKEIQDTVANDIKLHQMKDKISDVLQCIKELENSARAMGFMVKTVNEVEWNKKCKEVENKKTELDLHLRDLENAPGLLESVQEKITKRRKKREYLKRRTARWRKAKQETLEKRKMLHKQIDLWLSEMEEDVERTRREEELKQQADAVLSTVMQKKTEARKQIALLTALLQLRQARVTAMLGTGRTVSQTDINTFNEVIEKLKAMWTKQMDEYLLEEQGLRVMLSESEVYKTFSAQSQEKQIYRQWEEAIFGPDNTCKVEPLNLEEFIERRREWDQFVVNERTVMASSIPIGWVLPVPPSDDMWKLQLKSSK